MGCSSSKEGEEEVDPVAAVAALRAGEVQIVSGLRRDELAQGYGDTFSRLNDSHYTTDSGKHMQWRQEDNTWVMAAAPLGCAPGEAGRIFSSVAPPDLAYVGTGKAPLPAGPRTWQEVEEGFNFIPPLPRSLVMVVGPPAEMNTTQSLRVSKVSKLFDGVYMVDRTNPKANSRLHYANKNGKRPPGRPL